MRFARESPFPARRLDDRARLRAVTRDDLPRGDHADARGGDARRRARARARRGRRRGRAVGRDRRAGRGVRRRARAQHADQRGGDLRGRDRRRAVRARARWSRSCSSTSSRSRSTSSSTRRRRRTSCPAASCTVPLVLRTQGGAGQRGGAQHSQSLEAWLTHVPGLKVAMPSTAADAAGLLARRDRRPEPGRARREQDALLPPRGGSTAARRCRSAARGSSAPGQRRHRRRALAARPRGARRRRASSPPTGSRSR